MSKGDMLFEFLGYEKDINSYCLKYKNQDSKIIRFNNDKTITCLNFYGGYENLTLQELKAVNEKVDELGWLDEKESISKDEIKEKMIIEEYILKDCTDSILANKYKARIEFGKELLEDIEYGKKI